MLPNKHDLSNIWCSFMANIQNAEMHVQPCLSSFLSKEAGPSGSGPSDPVICSKLQYPILSLYDALALGEHSSDCFTSVYHTDTSYPLGYGSISELHTLVSNIWCTPLVLSCVVIGTCNYYSVHTNLQLLMFPYFQF